MIVVKIDKMVRNPKIITPPSTLPNLLSKPLFYYLITVLLKKNFFNLHFKIYLFLVVWVFTAVCGLSLVAGAIFCCNEWASHCSGFCCRGAQALGKQASLVVACRLQDMQASVVVGYRLSSCGLWSLELGLR